MKLTKIEIKGLFDLFDYEIPLTNNENLLIITGPNGFGKTMILNIIDSLFNNNLDFFLKLVFENITIYTDSNIQIEINKSLSNENEDIYIEVIYGTTILADLTYFQFKIDLLQNGVKKNEKKSIIESMQDSSNQFYKKLFSITDSLKVHLIKEQRLLKINTITESDPFEEDDLDEYDIDERYVFNTIEEYAKQLKNIINTYLQESYSIIQQIDSSFPKRLLNEKGSLTIAEFYRKFQLLREKQEKLKRFGLFESEQEIPDYDEKNASVLLVYLKDSEDKIKVFDELLNKLELFTGILNERRFTYKSIKI